MDAATSARLVEIRARRSSLVRRLSELCFLPASDDAVLLLRKCIRSLDAQEDHIHAQRVVAYNRSYGGTVSS